jgi:hypothetical protein
MGYPVFLETMLEIALSFFPLFDGGSEYDADMKGSEDDPVEIYSVPFTWTEQGGY